MTQLFVGLIAEGTTDVRFLRLIIDKLLFELQWECHKQVEFFSLEEVSAQGDTFVEKMLDAARVAWQERGMEILFIHADSDNRTEDAVWHNKFQPLFQALEGTPDDEYCPQVVPTIPVQMIESWMLADKELFKRLINAKDKQDAQLGIEKDPEQYSDPKQTIVEAIRKASEGKPRKRRDEVTISDLYDMLGNSLSLDKLRQIPSFSRFEGRVKEALRSLGLMH